MRVFVDDQSVYLVPLRLNHVVQRLRRHVLANLYGRANRSNFAVIVRGTLALAPEFEHLLLDLNDLLFLFNVGELERLVLDLEL